MYYSEINGVVKNLKNAVISIKVKSCDVRIKKGY